ncbi:MAG TPA: F0F1 ATP synthase subunit alpha [Myxococcales bacterium]|jgi:F-type H+-transporting ATPase subunit alpha
MPTLPEELGRFLPRARRRLAALEVSPRLEQIGRVVQVGDGVATVSGLPDARLDELLVLANGTRGLAVSLEPDRLGCILLGSQAGLGAGSAVRCSGEEACVPVGESLLGRVVDALGAPLDGGAMLEGERSAPVERPAPSVFERDLVSRPLLTGITVIDATIPLGRGQRELLIGDRQTGKTAIAVDTILNQRESGVICVYAAIGQKDSTVNGVVEALRRHGSLRHSVVVVAGASAPPGAQWLAPYSACSIAEYFRDRGQDALLVIDDLTKHAAVYRQLSLLLRDPPGREAYPGDIFHIHARLLERAARLGAACGGGSLTAMPIAETQAGNLAAYIPTNLISITDGQIYLEPKLFYEGQKPAVNVGKSVSRVGGKTQAPAMTRLAESLRLEYSQFLELEVFSRFGAMVDERTHGAIEHGRRLRALLIQPQFDPLRLSEQVALLLALQERVLDALPVERVDAFRTEARRWLSDEPSGVRGRIEQTGELSDEDRAALLGALRALAGPLAAPSGRD